MSAQRLYKACTNTFVLTSDLYIFFQTADTNTKEALSTRLITMRSQPNCFEAVLLLLLLF